jgi:hypothetical protein
MEISDGDQPAMIGVGRPPPLAAQSRVVCYGRPLRFQAKATLVQLAPVTVQKSVLV